MFRELDFQNKVFNTLSYYLKQLADRKCNANKISKVKEENPDIDMPIPDFTEDAFEVVKKMPTYLYRVTISRFRHVQTA